MIFLTIFSASVSAAGTAFTLYYSAECPHCQNVLKYLSDKGLENRFSIIKKEVGDSKNADEMLSVQIKCGVSEFDQDAVPTLYYQEKCYIGETDIYALFDRLSGCIVTDPAECKSTAGCTWSIVFKKCEESFIAKKPADTASGDPKGSFCEKPDTCSTKNCINNYCCDVNECGDNSKCYPVDSGKLVEGVGKCVGEGRWIYSNGRYASKKEDCIYNYLTTRGPTNQDTVCCDQGQCGCDRSDVSHCPGSNRCVSKDGKMNDGSGVIFVCNGVDWKLDDGEYASSAGSCNSGYLTTPGPTSQNTVCCGQGQCGCDRSDVGNCPDKNRCVSKDGKMYDGSGVIYVCNGVDWKLDDGEYASSAGSCNSGYLTTPGPTSQNTVCCGQGQCGCDRSDVSNCPGSNRCVSKDGTMNDGSGVTYVCNDHATWKLANGEYSDDLGRCLSGHINNGYCCGTGQCGYDHQCYEINKGPSGRTCQSDGTWLVDRGVSCGDNDKCAGDAGVCSNGVCCSGSECGFSGEKNKCFADGGVREPESASSKKQMCSKGVWGDFSDDLTLSCSASKIGTGPYKPGDYVTVSCRATGKNTGTPSAQSYPKITYSVGGESKTTSVGMDGKSTFSYNIPKSAKEDIIIKIHVEAKSYTPADATVLVGLGCGALTDPEVCAEKGCIWSDGKCIDGSGSDSKREKVDCSALDKPTCESKRGCRWSTIFNKCEPEPMLHTMGAQDDGPGSGDKGSATGGDPEADGSSDLSGFPIGPKKYESPASLASAGDAVDPSVGVAPFLNAGSGDPFGSESAIMLLFVLGGTVLTGAFLTRGDSSVGPDMRSAYVSLKSSASSGMSSALSALSGFRLTGAKVAGTSYGMEAYSPSSSIQKAGIPTTGASSEPLGLPTAGSFGTVGAGQAVEGEGYPLISLTGSSASGTRRGLSSLQGLGSVLGGMYSSSLAKFGAATNGLGTFAATGIIRASGMVMSGCSYVSGARFASAGSTSSVAYSSQQGPVAGIRTSVLSVSGTSLDLPESGMKVLYVSSGSGLSSYAGGVVQAVKAASKSGPDYVVYGRIEDPAVISWAAKTSDAKTVKSYLSGADGAGIKAVMAQGTKIEESGSASNAVLICLKKKEE